MRAWGGISRWCGLPDPEAPELLQVWGTPPCWTRCGPGSSGSSFCWEPFLWPRGSYFCRTWRCAKCMLQWPSWPFVGYLSCFGGPVLGSVSISVIVSRSGTQIKLRIFAFPKQRKQAAIPSPAGLTVHPFMETLKRLSSCYMVKGILEELWDEFGFCLQDQ